MCVRVCVCVCGGGGGGGGGVLTRDKRPLFVFEKRRLLFDVSVSLACQTN